MKSPYSVVILYSVIIMSFLILICCSAESPYKSYHSANYKIDSLIPYRKGNLWGYADPSGKIVIPPAYDSAGRFMHSRESRDFSHTGHYTLDPQDFALVYKGQYWGTIDRKGNFMTIMKCKGRIISYSSEAYCEPQQGFINNKGAFIPLSKKYKTIFRGYRERTGVEDQDGLRGFIDDEGNEVIPCQYEYTYSFRYNDYTEVTKNGKTGMIDRFNNIIIPLEYDEFGYSVQSNNPSHQNLLVVSKEGKRGIIDRNNKIVIPLKYTEITGFFSEEGLTAVRIGDKRDEWLIINMKDHVVGKLNYFIASYPDFLSKKLFPAASSADHEAKFGAVSRDGKVVVPLKYEVLDYHETPGVFQAKYEGKWGCLDSMGREITPFIYDHMFRLFDNRIRVIKEGKYGFLDDQGREVVACKYDMSYDFSEGRAAVAMRSLGIGFIDKHGNELIPLKYDMLSTLSGNNLFFKNGLTQVFKNNRAGYINKDGKEYFED